MLQETMKWTITVIQLHKQTGNETILITRKDVTKIHTRMKTTGWWGALSAIRVMLPKFLHEQDHIHSKNVTSIKNAKQYYRVSLWNWLT